MIDESDIGYTYDYYGSLVQWHLEWLYVPILYVLAAQDRLVPLIFKFKQIKNIVYTTQTIFFTCIENKNDFTIGCILLFLNKVTLNSSFTDT